MRVDTVTTFFALLAVFALLVLVVVAVSAVVAGTTGRLPGPLAEARAAVGQVSLVLAFFVALTCTLGSLYLSEVAKFPPCDLCWYQRILMYPQVVILGVAALRRDASVKWYSVPLVGLGVCISAYHYLIERFPESVKFSCESDNPCSTVWVWKFHFLSIPAMAGIGFALIGVLVMLSAPRATSGTERPAVDDSPHDQSPDDQSPAGRSSDDADAPDTAHVPPIPEHTT